MRLRVGAPDTAQRLLNTYLSTRRNLRSDVDQLVIADRRLSDSRSSTNYRTNTAQSNQAERFRASITPSLASRGRWYCGRKTSVLSCFLSSVAMNARTRDLEFKPPQGGWSEDDRVFAVIERPLWLDRVDSIREDKKLKRNLFARGKSRLKAEGRPPRGDLNRS
jgi:hypothetical protein